MSRAIDSLFPESIGRVVKQYAIPATLCSLHLSVMREHDRKAVLLHWADNRWQETPDWRLDRHVIRVGLYLRERVGLTPSDRVAILSPLRKEWLVAELAVVVQGAAAVAIDPGLPEAALAAALAQVAPRVAFVSGPTGLEQLEKLRSRVPCLEKIIAFEGPVAPERADLWSKVLDLGGTLDTAERAQAFRARAREVNPGVHGVGHLERGADGSETCKFLSHGEVIERLKPLWSRAPARKGDLAYVAGGAVTLEVLLALAAFVGDGYTTTAVGTPGREIEEIAELRPHKIVAPAGVLNAAVVHAPGWPRADAGARKWLERAAPVARQRQRDAARKALGGRARWIRPTGPLEPALSQRLQEVVTIDLQS